MKSVRRAKRPLWPLSTTLQCISRRIHQFYSSCVADRQFSERRIQVGKAARGLQQGDALRAARRRCLRKLQHLATRGAYGAVRSPGDRLLPAGAQAAHGGEAHRGIVPAARSVDYLFLCVFRDISVNVLYIF